MTNPAVRMTPLTDSGDQRGASYQTGTGWLNFLGKIDDAHIATILPGFVRGNHYHRRRREVIAVLFSDAWQLAFDEGENTPTTSKDFTGAGAVLLEVEPLAAHAIANTGQAPLWIIGLSVGAFDPDRPDSFARKVLP